MTKSRMALMLLLAVLPNPAGALPAGADQLIGTQRRSLRTLMRIECPSAEDPDAIVVCGSREEEDRRHRLPQATAARPAGRAAPAASSGPRWPKPSTPARLWAAISSAMAAST